MTHHPQSRLTVPSRGVSRRIVNALRKEKVYIGRVWPAWPTYARITVGTREEMAKFRASPVKVMHELQA
jgi:histidinol-phosphate/aromatic aminotransferase/cobyric acid decarboxylase-like protein